ncbi:hypothetical protein IEO21_03553 [Rhodonia placenta]|uniref:Transmembrane protein n=1 Tax=Rhodonia placenta TaxID=104341 RepID=A0A8H7P5K4_9APHY|nr:hypothetical protein IEO21_03553 [Postia placenta]
MSTRHSFLSTTGLVRAPSDAGSKASSRHARFGGTKPEKKHPKSRAPALVTVAGIRPLGPMFLIGMAIGFSLIFIVSISFAFVGSDEDEPPFKEFLDNIAKDNPGIVLVGDNVDVDVDEPAVTIRWSMIGCGPGFVLSGSEGTHGSTECGIPSIAMNVFVDSASDAAATYDPDLFPVVNKTGRRLGIQNLYQFDSDHVLDVHEARLYPFDTYHLTSTLRVASTNGDPILLSALTTLKVTSSFAIAHTDVQSNVNTSNSVNAPSRDIELNITRPPEARMFALLLFGVSWMLAHATIGFTVLAWMRADERSIFQYLGLVAVTLLAIPQLRNAMPDAPGFDDKDTDSIGFFPQMLMVGVSAICMLSMAAKRALQGKRGHQEQSIDDREGGPSQPVLKGLERLRRQGSTVDFKHVRSWSRDAFI